MPFLAVAVYICAFVSGAVAFAYMECYKLAALTLVLLACMNVKWSDDDKKEDSGHG